MPLTAAELVELTGLVTPGHSFSAPDHGSGGVNDSIVASGPQAISIPTLTTPIRREATAAPGVRQRLQADVAVPWDKPSPGSRQRRTKLTESDWRTTNARCTLGLAIVQQLEMDASLTSEQRGERLAEAEQILAAGFEQLSAVAPSIPARVRSQRVATAARALARLHSSWESYAPGAGHAEQAAEWSRRAEELTGR